MNVVVDTNVFFKAIFYKEKWCCQVFEKEFEGIIKIAMNAEINSEITLTFLLHMFTNRIKKNCLYRLSGKLSKLLWRIEKTEHITESNLCTSDPDDDKFIDCAVDSNSQYIITLDGSHLFGLEQKIKDEYGLAIKILSPYQLINELNTLNLKKRINSKRI